MTLDDLAEQLNRIEGKLDRILRGGRPRIRAVPSRTEVAMGHLVPSAESPENPPPHGPVKIDWCGPFPGEEAP